jgi:hypothetical protein
MPGCVAFERKRRGGALSCRCAQEEGLVGSGIPPTHGSAKEEGWCRHAQEEGRRPRFLQPMAMRHPRPSNIGFGGEESSWSDCCGTTVMQRGERSSLFKLPLSSVAKNGMTFALHVGD